MSPDRNKEPIELARYIGTNLPSLSPPRADPEDFKIYYWNRLGWSVPVEGGLRRYYRDRRPWRFIPRTPPVSEMVWKSFATRWSKFKKYSLPMILPPRD